MGDADWVYAVSGQQPSGTVTRTVTADRVIHCMYAVHSPEPWRGLGPLQLSRDTVRVAARIETQLAHGFSGAMGYVVPVPDANQTELQKYIKNLKGKTLLAPSTASGWDADGGANRNTVRCDWEPRRLGAHPPPTVGTARDSVSQSILAAAGVPASLLGRSDGTLLRESYRQFLHGTIQPVAKIVAVELAEKLDADGLGFDFSELFASDVSGRARAFGSMVNGGISKDDAAALAGLLSE